MEGWGKDSLSDKWDTLGLNSVSLTIKTALLVDAFIVCKSVSIIERT